jgi:hypothetical protein
MQGRLCASSRQQRAKVCDCACVYAYTRWYMGSLHVGGVFVNVRKQQCHCMTKS